MREGYKVTELGEIPEEWEVVKLAKVAKCFVGIASSATHAYASEGVLLIRNQNIKEGWLNLNDRLFINREYEIQHKSKRLKAGDILTVRTGYPGTSAVVPESLAGSQSFTTLITRLTTDKLQSQYLCYYVNSEKGKSFFTDNQAGNGQQNVGSKTLENLTVPLPPLPEQQKIASILSTVDEKIEVIDEQIKQTQELKKGLMQQLLTKGIGHTKFKSSELGEIPENWEVKLLNDIVYFSNGKGHEQVIDEKGRYVVVNSKFVSTEGRIRKHSKQNISPLHKGQIVMVMSDIPNGRAIAKCFYIDEDDLYTLNQRICSFTVKEDINSKFLFYFLNRNKHYLAYDNGVGQTNLRKEDVLNCPVIIPSIAQQQKIASILSTVDEKIDSLKSKKQTYQQLKKGLMQQLLTGKVRVKIHHQEISLA